ncbi:DUF3857 domain-containing protein [Croceiramulus getboli]|nr:DUF3857 domain-containing protein [Flavobacteriaceae bacterium YJPT1-3]
MHSKLRLPLILLLLTTSLAQAQDYEYGEVSKAELEMNVYEQDSTADAVMLHRYRNTYFDHDYSDGWVIITEMHERIKILTKEGLDQATKKIRYYRNGRSEEDIRSIDGKTYSLVNGKIEQEKLRKDGILETEVNEHWSETALVMPQVKVGSVIEYKYKIYSPFWKIDDLVFQEDIPVAHQFIKIQTPEYFQFQRLIMGYYNISPKQYFDSRLMQVSYNSTDSYGGRSTHKTQFREVTYTETVAEYTVEHMPRLREESYTDNIENYRSKVLYELSATNFPGTGLKSYSQSWKEVVKSIYDSDNFGKQLDRANHLDDLADRIKSESTSALEMSEAAFQAIKSGIAWNNFTGKYADQGLRKAYESGSGNVAEINLNLVALLRACGVEAYPVLVSTRNHGIPLVPTLEGFNYVIAASKINGAYTFYDATEKLCPSNVLPERTLNWVGRLVQDNGYSIEVDMFPQSIQQQYAIMNYTIAPSGSLEGKVMNRFEALDALEFRKTYGGQDTGESVDRIINTYKLTEASNYERENLNALEEPVQESYEFKVENGVDLIGNKMYIDPLIFLRMTSNPFKAKERSYPVDFIHPFKVNKRINIKLPEGYTVESLPEPVSIALPENMGSFIYNIGEFNGSLNVMAQFTMNSKVILPSNYAMLKEFYQTRVNKENEKVVLVKAAP